MGDGVASYELWTIQSQTTWERFVAEGVLRTDEELVWPEFLPAYRWMAAQMRSRLPACTERMPIWAWHRPRPDLRRAGHLPPGSMGVCICFTLPALRVLLSDFIAWHSVLNGWYLALSEAECDAWESSLPRGCHWYEELPPDRQREVRASWERVFDLENLALAKDWLGTGEYIQATIEEVHLEDIIEVTTFVAR